MKTAKTNIFFLWIKKIKDNKNWKRPLLASIISAILLLILSYTFNNLAMPISNTEYSAIQVMEKLFGPPRHAKDEIKWSDSILLLNTSYDIDTIPHYVYNSPSTHFSPNEGYYTITNRQDIYRTLKAFAKDTTSYRYILLDIALDSLPRHHSAHIDSLVMYTDSIVDLIVSMPRICVANSNDFDLVSDTLKAKAGMVDYKVTPSVTNFLKYDLVQNGTTSVPLKMYSELNHTKVNSYLFGGIYMDGHRLCKKNIIPIFPFRFKAQEYGWEMDDKGDTIWAYIEEGYTDLRVFRERYVDKNRVEALSRDKIVAIGDLFAKDIHQTYVGELSGPVINLNTYINLVLGMHMVSILDVIYLFFLYISMFFVVIFWEKWWYKIPFWQRFWQADVVQIIFSFFGWGIIFIALSIFLYYKFGIFYNIWLPVLWFTFVSKIYKLIIYPKDEK